MDARLQGFLKWDVFVAQQVGGEIGGHFCGNMKNSLLSLVAGIFAVVLISLSVMPRKSVAALGAGSTQLPIGRNCTVQLRRGDGLGAAATAPVSPVTGNSNGGDTSVSGKLYSVNEEWVVIEGVNDSLLWIPKGSILLVQV